jgi:hypothetical protein
MYPKSVSDIKLNGRPYRDHLILFIDILGYKNLMLSNNEVRKRAILKLQKKACDSDKTGYLKKDQEEQNRSTLKARPLTTLLSDTIIYSFPLADLAAVKDELAFTLAYRFCARKILDLHTLFMKEGMLIRGSVVIGKISNYDGMAYGEGLARAHDLQSGKSPFVYFDKDIISFMKDYGFTQNVSIYLNKDKKHSERYFDYLRLRFTGTLGEKYRLSLFKDMDLHITQINRNLVLTANKQDAYEKWQVIADYYDHHIQTHNNDVVKWSSEPELVYKNYTNLRRMT